MVNVEKRRLIYKFNIVPFRALVSIAISKGFWLASSPTVPLECS